MAAPEILVLPTVIINLAAGQYTSGAEIGETGEGSRISLVRPQGFFPFVSVRMVVTTTISGGTSSLILGELHPASSGGGAEEVPVGKPSTTTEPVSLVIDTTGYTLAVFWQQGNGAVKGLADVWFSYNILEDRTAGIIECTPILRKFA